MSVVAATTCPQLGDDASTAVTVTPARSLGWPLMTPSTWPSMTPLLVGSQVGRLGHETGAGRRQRHRPGEARVAGCGHRVAEGALATEAAERQCRARREGVGPSVTPSDTVTVGPATPGMAVKVGVTARVKWGVRVTASVVGGGQPNEQSCNGTVTLTWLGVEARGGERDQVDARLGLVGHAACLRRVDPVDHPVHHRHRRDRRLDRRRHPRDRRPLRSRDRRSASARWTAASPTPRGRPSPRCSGRLRSSRRR